MNPTTTELAAAVLQGTITLGLGVLFVVLFVKHRKPYFAWFATAWLLYGLRVGVIVLFLLTEVRVWLYWHQVMTGWTALTLLWASLVFSEHLRWRPAYVLLATFPILWSYVAIYVLDNFLLAAGPAVAFLSAATVWTGGSFLRFSRRVRSAPAAFVGAAFVLWALHHLDYPFLRAQGAWAPWGYYLDILFVLSVGIGVVLVALDDLHRGIGALTALSSPLSSADGASAMHRALLDNALTLPGVRGGGLYLAGSAAGRFVAGVGTCEPWTEHEAPTEVLDAVKRVLQSKVPETLRGTRDLPYLAVLPVAREGVARGALVMVSDARNPFAALDRQFLLALGRQVDAALENADLTRSLAARTHDLERLAATITEHHEADRRRLARELHDETAQVFSAVRLQLGVLQEESDPDRADRLAKIMHLVDTGVDGIRAVTDELRPPVLDELGLPAALRALGATFADRTDLAIEVECDGALPTLAAAAELAFYRAAQEGLANAVRHADSRRIELRLHTVDDGVALDVSDDGKGVDPEKLVAGGNGLAYMRERFAHLGGDVSVAPAPTGGTTLVARLPLAHPAAS